MFSRLYLVGWLQKPSNGSRYQVNRTQKWEGSFRYGRGQVRLFLFSLEDRHGTQPDRVAENLYDTCRVTCFQRLPGILSFMCCAIVIACARYGVPGSPSFPALHFGSTQRRLSGRNTRWRHQYPPTACGKYLSLLYSSTLKDGKYDSLVQHQHWPEKCTLLVT